MKGKKLIITILAVFALVVTSVAFAFNSNVEKIRYANATTIDMFTAELEGGIIFSAEQVYIADSVNRGTAFTYHGEGSHSIATNTGNKHFMDYGGNEASKHFIRDGEFVKVDDRAQLTANVSGGTVTLKQGIMVTLGSYYFAKDENDNNINNANTNTKKYVGNKWESVGDDEEVGAGMGYVSVQAKRNGQEIEVPSSRGYANSSKQDFTWFIESNELRNEGHYELSFIYEAGGKTLRYDFDFYMLLESSYDKTINVNNFDYPSKPTLEGVEAGNKFYSGKSLNYPTLTFDYSRYDLSYTHKSGDVLTEVDFNYDEATQTLSLSQKVYNDIEVKNYIVDTDRSNTVVTLMFVDHGTYDFHFDHIYKYQGEKIIIPQDQAPFQNIPLTIHGYQLKYAKAGFASADMTYLEIYKNNTMFILVNGFINADNEKMGDNLGVQYKLINTVNAATGNIKISTDSKTASARIEDFKTMDDDDLHKIKYQKTDRGLWLTLNDEYHLGATESYCYYDPDNKITKNFINGLEDVDGKPHADKNDDKDPDYSDNSVKFEKVTTFTAPGYYLVQVAYEYAENKFGYQWFAFQITASTPVLELYKTELDEFSNSWNKGDNSEGFYAHEYTNQNVYAWWEETEIFESNVVAKLYYVKGNYARETTLKSVANGGQNSTVTKLDYNKFDLIKDSSSYLLVLEVERSVTKTYTYFTIDKDPISGLEVYEVAANAVDNRAVYGIRQDSGLNYITHTSKAVIDTMFTMSWADKSSGAGINAVYKFTPFVKSNQDRAGKPILVESATNSRMYIMNEYTLGSRSNAIEIQKPRYLNMALDVDNVLIDQGIYEFYLEDQAGNKLTYIIVVDKTEGVFNATYGEGKSKYVSGQMVADYVELEWGTHKAVDLGSITQSGTVTTKEELKKDDIIYALIHNNDNTTNNKIENYYTSGNNWAKLVNMFATISGENLFVVENARTEIKLNPFKSGDSYYIITRNAEKQIKRGDGYTIAGWDTFANSIFENVTNMGVKINVDNDQLRRYAFEVIGSNQIIGNASTKFQVAITPDKAQGEVYSSTQEADYNNLVLAHGEATKYFEGQEGSNTGVKLNDYAKGQASNDGVFVFEWLVPRDGVDNFTVTEVKYNYYQLMDQNTLNQTTNPSNKGNYYPYKYISTNYILKTGAGGVEEVSLYGKTTRTVKDSNGNIIETKIINRSNPINLAYESYYDSNKALVSKKVTQTGLYIITRTISIKADAGSPAQTSEFSYAFFVDRNMIVGYSLTDINSKIVGQFIHVAMPNSESANGVIYDNFTKQGLKTTTQTYIEPGQTKGKEIKYEVYLETNKLPTRLQVPSGKYVSGNVEGDKDGNVDPMTIKATSYLNLYLKVSIYFRDTYNVLPSAYKGSFIKLVDGLTGNKDGYIDLSFASINEGALKVFKNARIHNEDGSLSLPGEYVFVINDTVSAKTEGFEVVDTNEFVFGIKLTNQAPKTDVYTYAEINGETSDNVYSEDYELYTNQEFIDFIIPVEDKDAYNAQLDIATIEVYRSDLGSKPWLRLKRSTTASDGFEADTNGLIQTITDTNRFVKIYENGNLVGYKIKLDTELEVDEDDNIISYKEYVYSIRIRYVLLNSAEKYYTYVSSQTNDGVTTSTTETFFMSTYTVTIDRTPNSGNLNSLMQQQNDYFAQYQAWLADKYGEVNSEEVNSSFAYRSTTAGLDYYALTNDLYYQFAENLGELSNQAMYALSVNENTAFNLSGLKEVYYRKLYIKESSIPAKTRMGLLPITDIYFETSGYYPFNENGSEYLSFASVRHHYDGFNNVYYWSVFGIEEASLNNDEYKNNSGSFYEIVEKDMAGNYTQYVIYFEIPETVGSENHVTLDITQNDDEEYPLTFTENGNNQKAFIGIKQVVLNGLAEEKIDTYEHHLPYYANINIYNAKRENLKKIYLNTTSVHGLEGIETEIYNIIKEQGNYIIECVDVYGNKTYITVNNYTSSNHQLNIATFEVEQDYSGGHYVTLSSLNTKISDGVFWYVKDVEIVYNGSTTVKYTAGIPENDKTVLIVAEGSAQTAEVHKDIVETDRINLAANKQYLFKFTDVGGKQYFVPISTSEGYYAYNLDIPKNTYARDNVYYTATEFKISYNKGFYDARITVIEDGVEQKFNIGDELADLYYTDKPIGTQYSQITLMPSIINDASDFGSVRQFNVKLRLIDNEDDDYFEFNIVIDTRFTNFNIENINKENRETYVKSTLKDGSDEDYQDYNKMDLIAEKYYTELLTETVNIKWTKLNSDYFNYFYDLYEFENAQTCVDLLVGSNVTERAISPKDKTTGKYVLKVTVKGKDGTWIATRVYGIYMSTTITGLYEVKDGYGNVYEYSAITNLEEIKKSVNYESVKTEMAKELGFGGDVNKMETVFASFGRYTAIPMYIANAEQLTLHSNADNGVSHEDYSPASTSYIKITIYRIYRANYYTFAVIMQVYKNESNESILKTLSFKTQEDKDGESLLNNGTAKIIYDADADYYKLTFSSFNRGTSSVPTDLEKYNKIIIDVYYNNVKSKRVMGGSGDTTTIEFKNSGSYKLEIRDIAGNIQYFSNASTTQEYFTVVVMKGMLYTINGEAPIPYAYYDNAVTLQINRYNEAIGKNNYDIRSIKLSAILNSKSYTGYEHPTESATYIFRDYGTYLITITANLLTGEEVSSQLVFTILNPNEARTALDFTSIYGYNIVSVYSITKTAEKDVTDKFMDLLKDRSNDGTIEVYNKLVTYERVAEMFGSSTQGKMKFRVLYNVENDDLLPERSAEFSFTLNNEIATLNSSIKPGDKTTKPVSIKFNAANIYDLIGDCNLVINGETVLRIDQNSLNQITEIQVTEVGQYYVQLMGDSGNVAHSFNFTIKEPLNTVAIILIVIIASIVIALIGTFIWLRTRMKVR